ncbi:MAG: bi-domain-containing oxidoreductase, partial [Cryomorphaceae bacterium]
MEQLLQSLKKGKMEIVTLPNPQSQKGQVLVRTYYSAISTGTEGKTVSDARKGYVAKAQSRKEEVSKVIKAAQNFGISDTYKMVMNKLESLQPLGYSLSGEVIDVGEGVKEFKPGDRVACGGATASHAELVVVPKNLVVKLQPKTPMDQAAFTTIGAIALQGIRRSGLNIGENAAVIGLGLIGQITVKLLKAAGIRAFGIDIKADLVDQALQSGAEGASLRSDALLETKVAEFAHGEGVDAVIITAGTSSLDPVELAGTLCRTHGKVVIVGSVPTGFSRKNYYRKELELLMSTSYGPGRYDSNYEEKGLDYPIGQVRWTENRNMQAFSEMLSRESIYLNDLITHRFDFENAQKAFDVVVDTEVEKMGVLLEYNTEKPISLKANKKKQSPSGTGVSVIGAGSFSGNFLMPNLATHMELDGVLTSRPHTAENARRKFGFKNAFASADELLDSDGSAAVVIATRHDTHADFAMRALEKGKRVFLEKPMCLNKAEYLSLRSRLIQ